MCALLLYVNHTNFCWKFVDFLKFFSTTTLTPSRRRVVFFSTTSNSILSSFQATWLYELIFSAAEHGPRLVNLWLEMISLPAIHESPSMLFRMQLLLLLRLPFAHWCRCAVQFSLEVTRLDYCNSALFRRLPCLRLYNTRTAWVSRHMLLTFLPSEVIVYRCPCNEQSHLKVETQLYHAVEINL